MNQKLQAAKLRITKNERGSQNYSKQFQSKTVNA